MSPAERTKTEKNDGVEKQEEHFKPEIQEACSHTFQCSMYVNKKQTNKQKTTTVLEQAVYHRLTWPFTDKGNKGFSNVSAHTKKIIKQT